MAKVGRKTVFTPEVIRKIEEAAAFDASVDEMAFYAGINVATLYSKLEDDKEFSERITALRNRPVLKARQTAVNKLGESYTNAMDYLSRKRKHEFSYKSEVEHSGNVNIGKLLDEAEKQNERPTTPQ